MTTPYWRIREDALAQKLDRIERVTPVKGSTLGVCLHCETQMIRPVQTVKTRTGLYHLTCWREIIGKKKQ